MGETAEGVKEKKLDSGLNHRGELVLLSEPVRRIEGRKGKTGTEKKRESVNGKPQTA